MAVGFGRDFGDGAVVLFVGIGVGEQDGLLAEVELGKVGLVDVEFDFDIVQIGEGDDEALGAADAGEAGGDELALFDVTLKNGAADGGLDDGVVELCLGEFDATALPYTLPDPTA